MLLGAANLTQKLTGSNGRYQEKVGNEAPQTPTEVLERAEPGNDVMMKDAHLLPSIPMKP